MKVSTVLMSFQSFIFVIIYSSASYTVASGEPNSVNDYVLTRFAKRFQSSTIRRRIQSSSMSPSVSPTSNTLTRSSTTSPSMTTPSECSDSQFKFKVPIDNKGKVSMKLRTCAWVAKSAADRCEYSGVAVTCPRTCGTCGVCEDSQLKFSLPGSIIQSNKPNLRPRRSNDSRLGEGRRNFQSCGWVANGDTSRHCAISGISDTCRATCGTC